MVTIQHTNNMHQEFAWKFTAQLLHVTNRHMPSITVTEQANQVT